VISGVFGALNGLKGSSPHSQAFLDISSSRDLYFLTMVGWENRHKEAHSATTAEKETLIFMAGMWSLGWEKITGGRISTLSSLMEVRPWNCSLQANTF